MIAAGGNVLADISLSGTVTDEQIKDNLPLLTLVELLLVGTIVISLIGAILGIIGLLQKHRRKVYATLGTILNSLGWVIVIVMFSLQTLGTAT